MKTKIGIFLCYCEGLRSADSTYFCSFQWLEQSCFTRVITLKATISALKQKQLIRSTKYLIFFKIFKFLLYFFSFTVFSPKTHPRSNHHIPVHIHESFSLLLNPFTLSPPPPTICHPAHYQSVPIFLVSSVCSLDFTYEWNPFLFVFLWLAYFT